MAGAQELPMSAKENSIECTTWAANCHLKNTAGHMQYVVSFPPTFEVAFRSERSHAATSVASIILFGGLYLNFGM